MARIIIDVPDNVDGDDLQIVICGALAEYQYSRFPSPEIYVRERYRNLKSTSPEFLRKVAQVERYLNIAQTVRDAMAKDNFLVEE